MTLTPEKRIAHLEEQITNLQEKNDNQAQQLIEQRMLKEQLSDKLDAARTELESQRVIMANLRKDAANVHESWAADMTMIGKELADAADANNLCAVYDEVIDDINKRIIKPIPTRMRKFVIHEVWTVSRYLPAEGRNPTEVRERHLATDADRSWYPAHSNYSGSRQRVMVEED